MPDVRDLLRRWGRLKPSEEDANENVTAEGQQADAAPPELPPVEELGEGSDFTAFLRPEVPAALRRAALRRAWNVTPAIARHKPLVDYDWDFHAPGAGRLKAGDDPGKLIARLFSSRRTGEAGAASGPPAAHEPAEGADIAFDDADAEQSPHEESPQNRTVRAEEPRTSSPVDPRHRVPSNPDSIGPPSPSTGKESS